MDVNIILFNEITECNYFFGLFRVQPSGGRLKLKLLNNMYHKNTMSSDTTWFKYPFFSLLIEFYKGIIVAKFSVCVKIRFVCECERFVRAYTKSVCFREVCVWVKYVQACIQKVCVFKIKSCVSISRIWSCLWLSQPGGIPSQKNTVIELTLTFSICSNL